MQTYSHFILTAVLVKPLKRLRANGAVHLPPVPNSALLIGSILPDLPLIILGITAIARDRFTGVFADPMFSMMAMDTPPTEEMLARSWTMRLFDDWFFTNPWVIAVHNLFHSPLLVAIYIVIGYLLWRRGSSSGPWFFWLACAAMLHTLIDIPLHADDGPLLLFPLNWEWRFHSPISYWDPDYYGNQWSIFEHLLIGGLLLYLLQAGYRYWRLRRTRNQVAEADPPTP